MPDTLTQIAVGIGDIDGNPELWDILAYTRSKGIVPNITINGSRINEIDLDQLKEYCGAVAVSYYNDRDCFNTIYRLATNREMKQINIHMLLAKETFQKCMNLMKESLENWRLRDLNAIVFLWLKPKGNRNKYHQITKNQYEQIVDFALKHDIKFGFDSCSAPFFTKTYKNHSMFDPNVLQMVESCESCLFSYYVNVDGIGYPCSFAEGIKPGVDLLIFDNFWNHPHTQNFRVACIASKDQNDCRNCIIYDLKFQEEIL